MERALELIEAGQAIAGSLGDRHREAALRNRHADLLHAAGRLEEAMTELKAAAAIFAEVGEEGNSRSGSSASGEPRRGASQNA